MADWLISRNMNMTFENVVMPILHPEISNTSGNPAATPNTLQDWGFLTADKKPSELGAALVSQKINWNEAALVALAKRGSNDVAVPIKPFVAFCKVLNLLRKNDPAKAFLSPRAFDRLLTIRSYNELTEEFCLKINDSGPASGTYRDIWYNALTETGLFLRRQDIERGTIGLVESKAVYDFVDYVAEHGEAMSACPIKSIDNAKYFAYMGSLYTGIVEILKDAPDELLTATFPHFLSLKHVAGILLHIAPQTDISSFIDFVLELQAGAGNAGLRYDFPLIKRFVGALLAKPFVVLTGLSGSGKTKLAQLFVEWMKFKSLDSGLLLKDESFNGGAYKVVASDEFDYKILVAETGKIRTVSKNAIKLWITYFRKHPEKIGADSLTIKEIRKEIQNIDDVDDNYMHGSDAILNHIACSVLSKRDPFAEAQIQNSLLVPVGADWTNSEHLLGYPDALQPGQYVMPETRVLKLMLDARDNPKLPFFLILDEMNLSHVERYFADFLSAMESGEDIKLYGGDNRSSDGIKIPQTLKFPKNLFIIGTMNVDETTYMFSPKVLDRAQVIEFRVSEDDMKNFLTNPSTPNLAAIESKGAKYAEAFLKLKDAPPALDAPGSTTNKDAIAAALNKFFPELVKLGAEFGYRSAGEIVRFCAYYLAAGATIDDAIDAAIVQKLLPKLHGSQARLGPVLRKLKELATKEETVTLEGGETKKVRTPLYTLTCEKLDRMLDRLKANGFTSFAEA